MNLKKLYLPAAVITLIALFFPLLVGPTSAASSDIQSSFAITGVNSLDPFPSPPNVSKITISSPNADGYAAVAGASGALPGNVAVAIVNQNTRNVITTDANSAGAFAATLFAPPGSSLLIKYSPNPDLIDVLWEQALNPGGDFS